MNKGPAQFTGDPVGAPWVTRIPDHIQEKVNARIKAREDKDWAMSDQLRDEIQSLGYMVQDSKDGMKVIKQ